FVDGTRFVVSSCARMELKGFVRDPAGNLCSALVSFVRGAFSFLVGQISTAGGLTIDTPVASIRSRGRGSGIGVLSLTALTFSLIEEEARAASAATTFLDDGEIKYKDLEHGVFELRTKEANPRTIWVDDPAETIVLGPKGSSVVTNSATEMHRLQET